MDDNETAQKQAGTESRATSNKDSEPGSSSTLATLERYRHRAWSLAGLCATGAGALAAGLVLSPARIELSFPAQLMGGLSIALLLITVGAAGYAMLVTKKRRQKGNSFPIRRWKKFEKDESEPEKSGRVLRAINSSTKFGGVTAVLALLSLSAMASTVLLGGSAAQNVQITLTGEPLAALKHACPKIGMPLKGKLSLERVQAVDKTWVEFEIVDDSCAQQTGSSKILVDRESISLIELPRDR